MKLISRLLLLLSAVVICIAMMSGCSSSGDAPPPDVSDNVESREKVHYWFAVGGMVPNDVRDVQEDLNRIMLKELNTELILHPVGIADYASTAAIKINASDKEFDMCFTSPWLNNYAENVRREAYVELDDLLKEHGKDILSVVDEKYWEAARINNKIYGVINMQILPRQACVSLSKEMVDKSGFDIASIKKYEDMESFFEYCKQQGEKDICEMFDVQSFLPYFQWDDLGALYKIPGFVDANDPNGKVFNQYESDEWKGVMEMGARWYEKGYFKSDILTAYTNIRKICMRMPTTYKPGVEAEEVQYTGREFYVVPLNEPLMYSSWVIGTMNAISRTAQNPARCMKVLNLLYSNEEAFNMLVYGIEGRHYNKTGDKRVELIPDSGYNMPMAWEFGNQFNLWLQPTQNDNVWEKTKEINNTSKVSESYGFMFDSTKVKTEIANCTAVYDEYYMPLLLGLFDDTPAKYQEFLTKLNSAGADKIIAEKQAQLDAWRASK